MRLSGEYQYGSEEYFVFCNFTKASKAYYIYTKVAAEDRVAYELGDELQNPILDSRVNIYAAKDTRKYLLGAIKIVSGVQFYYNGDYSIVQKILELIKFAERYHFAKDKFFCDKEQELGESITRFHGDDGSLQFEYWTRNIDYSKLNIRYGQEAMSLEETLFFPKVKGIEFLDLPNSSTEAVTKATFRVIHYEDLEAALDMSWYKKDGALQKHYHAVHTIAEFEDMFSKMMEAACKTDQLIVALDTETTGVNVYNLAKDNPTLSRCVEISISWEDNEAYCIFTGMEYIQSMSAEYVFKRLAEIFTEERDDIKVTWDNRRRTEVFSRDRFHLVGQNFPFDRRVSKVEGGELWFDDDTLNMGFNVDPRVVRGNVKLKNMTRRVFHHETPELTDVLGKGNEAMYRLLEDEEVALIYAGADADYTRLLWFYLKKLLGEKMYHMYNKQDVRMLNILADSEYEGLHVIESEAKELAVQTEENLKILQETAYKYVGAYMDYQEKAGIIDAQYNMGIITKDEYESGYSQIIVDKEAKYEFEFKAADIRKVMYDILKYPIYSYTDTGVPKVDKYVRKKLLQETRKENSTARLLQHSILTYGSNYAEYEKLRAGSDEDKKKASKMELISVDEFNKLEYPLALLFEQYAILDKEYTSYYKPMLEDNLESKIFKSYSLARIETRRIMNPSQTMKKNLKKLVIPTSDDYYSVDFDLSQIELRLMYSLSESTELIEKMKNPENDAHTETAAMVNRIPAYMVSKNQRKGAKSVGFGEPYGLGTGSLCEKIFSDRTKEHMVETRVIVHAWEKINYKVVALLEAARDQALEPVELSEDKRNFMDAWQRDPGTKEYLLNSDGSKIPIPMGAVYNRLGFCRYFDLTNVGQTDADKKRRARGEYTPKESTIRRAAGNYPIQSYAAEFFRLILYRFYDRCKQEGIADKIVWNMLIHDELLCSVHKSVNPVFITKLIKESCMITMKNHTNYFVGINIGDNWKETKDDARELPVLMVERLIDRWDNGEFREQKWFDHPWDLIGPLRAEYVRTRIHEVLKQLQPDLDEKPINLPAILKVFDNYTVRAYVYDYPNNFKVSKDVPELIADDVKYQSVFESWMIDYYGEGKELIGIDGKVKKVYTGEKEDPVPKINAFDDDYDDTFADEEDYDDGDVFDDADAEQLNTVYRATAQDRTEQYEEDECYEYEKVAIHKYVNLRERHDSIEVIVDNRMQMNALIADLEEGKGKLIMFRIGSKLEVWKKALTSLDLATFDAKVSEVRYYPECVKCEGSKLTITVNKVTDNNKVLNWVRSNKGFGYAVYSKVGDSKSGVAKLVGSVKANSNFRSLEESLCQ